jgi:hypothetical protein
MHVSSPLGPLITILSTPYIYSDQQHTFKIENGSSGLFLIDAFQVEQDPPWHDKGKKKEKQHNTLNHTSRSPRRTYVRAVPTVLTGTRPCRCTGSFHSPQGGKTNRVPTMRERKEKQ